MHTLRILILALFALILFLVGYLLLNWDTIKRETNIAIHEARPRSP